MWGHMLDMAQKAIDALKDKSRPQFDQDEVLKAGVSYFIQTIGEAASKVSKEFRERNPDIPWNDIIGMRHKIVHDYLTVDFDVVWDVVKTELPPLLEKLKKIAG
jgi:uncharacterized protein with HEPN domain